jgi:hypothetical protein
MTTVRLFRADRLVGFVAFTETGHRMRPLEILTHDQAMAVRRELEEGRMVGSVVGYTWYRQASSSCPRDDSKPCPCDDEACGEELSTSS